MSDHSPDFASLDEGAIQHLDSVCDQFEERWHTGDRPRIEDFLPVASPGSDTHLFRELLALEIELRSAYGEEPQAEEYSGRFPLYANLIRAVLDAATPSRSRTRDDYLDSSTASYQLDKNNSLTVEVVPRRQIGRYRIERVLGKGGFGLVYLAFDNQLQRRVAIKVPYRIRVSSAAEAEAYLAEARTVANLDHPNIVPVYDVGNTDDCPCFIVSKYIDGTDLATMLKRARLLLHDAVELVTTVAEALHFAHKQSLVHRDIKPANILLDKGGKPFVADFGLALREQDVGKGPSYAGTPAFMSPEQARGEGHRVDGRSDIFSLGVVLYLLITGRQPFRGETLDELREQIGSSEVRPPRQIDDHIPKELDRICLRSLSKRASERYSTAQDMADDLRHFLAATSLEERSTLTQRRGGQAEIAGPGSSLKTPADSSSQPVKIVPKGLRSFDAHDADFFLELLPGPRDRDGLPDSVRFWKTRIEETNANQALSVGLLFGPSGCGKSSLVKAGLLPRLARPITAIYIEATAEGTEGRLLRGLRRQLPDLPSNLGLVDSLSALRRGQFLEAGQKVLLVLDQFEQWLHAKHNQENTDLVQALRHCDGVRLLGIVMVRDDFGMASTRFMSALDIPIVQGNNFATVDLFDLKHARKVLAAFGRAYDCLPENPSQLSKEQATFLDQAIAGLAQEGKVISVRIALFAEMVKGKPWTPASLRAVGGTEGVGITFLDETFASASANPRYRLHKESAPAVLKILLPDSGADIKGHMRSRQELLEASGYAERPQRFADLLSILDAELRLVTPTDPEGTEEDPDDKRTPLPPPQQPPSETSCREQRPYYQLTHDYLVPALRDWLTRKQRETWRGRAELKLNDRTAEWNSRREPQFLPPLPEYLWLACGVPRAKRSPNEYLLLATAGRYHGLRWGTAMGILCLVVFVLQQYLNSVYQKNQHERAETLITAVANAAPQEVSAAIEHLKPLRDVSLPILRQRFQDAPNDTSERLRTAFALAAFGEVEDDFLLQQMASLPASEASNMIAALSALSASSAPKLIHKIESEKSPDLRARCAAILLHLGDPRGAANILALQEDPTPRTAFIHNFESWHGNLAKLPDLLKGSSDQAFQSGIGAAIGLLDRTSIGPEERAGLIQICKHLYVNTPDGGVHSAAGWALRQWGEELPKLGETQPDPSRCGWFINSHGMTMLFVPAGEFMMGDVESSGAAPRLVSLKRPFFLCDREVSIDLYRQFLHDPDSAVRKPQSAWKDRGAPGDRAMGAVSWVDALLFCNWLSYREKRKPCYRESDPQAGQGKPSSGLAWTCNFDADGYRLPTEVEWEYACRARSGTAYSFGNEIKLLPNYAFFNLNSERQASPGGNKLPNGWGLFDMHGNVAEWCWHKNEQLSLTSVKSVPEQASDNKRPYRGGDYYNDGHQARSGCSGAWDVKTRIPYIGLRVLCSASQGQ